MPSYTTLPTQAGKKCTVKNGVRLIKRKKELKLNRRNTDNRHKNNSLVSWSSVANVAVLLPHTNGTFEDTDTILEKQAKKHELAKSITKFLMFATNESDKHFTRRKQLSKDV